MTGADHADASKVKAYPDESAAAQNVVVGQEMETSPPRLGSIFTGSDQVVPLKEDALPSRETPIQNVLDAQERARDPPDG